MVEDKINNKIGRHNVIATKQSHRVDFEEIKQDFIDYTYKNTYMPTELALENK